MMELKQEAVRLFHQSLRAVDVRAAMSRSFRVEGERLLAASSSFRLSGLDKIVIIALGKAATPMYEAAADVLRSAAFPPEKLTAIVASPQPPQTAYGAMTFFAGSHPTPSDVSRTAATLILHELHSVTSDTLVLFFISGGSSAMVELPLDPALSLEDLASFNRVLVGSGLAITEINTLRKHISAVKGGRLAEAAMPAMQCTLVISDVPTGSLETVGSGPSLPDSSSTAECADLYRRLRSKHPLPAEIDRVFLSGMSHETPKRSHACFAGADWTCILSSDDLAKAAANAARAEGFHVQIDNRCDDWPSEEAAGFLLGRSASLHGQHGRTCLISVGEVGVTLQEPSGKGGRNQHFALQSALLLAGHPRPTAILSAGSDGIDGNSAAAGAIADEHTCPRALSLSIDPAAALRSFDSFPLFQALGDLIVTGPTGNNLRDLRILLT